MFTILGIDHLVLRTKRIREMITFYCEILGCPIEKTQEAIGLTQIRAGSSIIDLIEVPFDVQQEKSNLEHFCLRLSTFHYKKLQKYFSDKKIKIYRYGQRYGASGYSESFYLRDPEGNEIELKAPHVFLSNHV